MTSEWRTIRAADFIDFNTRLSLKKGDIATKVAMDKLKPFTKKIPESEKAEFNGGAKFCNGDTVMARITPCLENGKTAYVDMLDDGEIGFGSTEFIVMRAKTGISDPQFVYYTAISPVFRNVAIKSMVGSSGRQRVQQSVLEELELSIVRATVAAQPMFFALRQVSRDTRRTYSAPYMPTNSSHLWLLDRKERKCLVEISSRL